MGKLKSKEELLQALKNIHAMEQTAHDHYVKDISIFHDIHIISALDSIRKDEEKHMQILEEMMELMH